MAEGEETGGADKFRGKPATPVFPRPKITKKGYVDPTMLRTSSVTAHSSQKASEKFSFGKANRFPSASKSASALLQRSKSSPAWSPQMSTTTCDPGELLEPSLGEFTSAGPSTMLDGGPSVDFTAASGGPSIASVSHLHTSLEGMPSDDEEFEIDSPSQLRHPWPPAENSLSAPRLDGSLMRLGEPQQRAALPRAKSYDPALTLGTGTSAAYHHSPHYSFGGGAPRVPDPKKKEHLASVTGSSSSAKGKMRPNPVSLMDLKDAVRPKKQRSAPLSRGFGSEARLSQKGGAMGPMPCAPGPGAYELARIGDLEPVWLASGRSTSCFWSKRSSERANMKNPSGNPANVGPGDAFDSDAVDRPMKAAGPSCIFGHPAHDIALPNFEGTDPMRYTVPSWLCRDRSPHFSVGAGKRPEMNKGVVSPGPARYSPKDDLSYEIGPVMSFSKSCRQHICDLIDPDEPPGPGAHTVRRDPKPTDKPSAGMPMDIKMRKVPGLGPDGPGPGDGFKGPPPSLLDKRGKSMAIRLDRPVRSLPGPHETAGPVPHDTDLLTQNKAASWGELVNRSSVRKPPWREVSQPPVFKLKSGETLCPPTVPMQFKPTGPKYTMMPRRMLKGEDVPMGMHAASEAMAVTTSIG